MVSDPILSCLPLRFFLLFPSASSSDEVSEKLILKISVKRADVHVKFWLLQQLVFFNLETKNTGFGKVMRKSAGCGIFVKKCRNAGSGQVVLDHYDIFIFIFIYDYLHCKSI